jgi:HK97 family phage prohead protease
MVAIEIRRAIPYRKTPLAPESQSWDGPSEVAKASVDDLRVMCAWVDDSAPDIEASYKLAHHVAGGDHECVWRGVAQCMSIMFGGRGGVDMPDSERRAVYNHLAAHYRDFDKEPPEWSPAAATRSTGPARLELRGAKVELRGADDPVGGARLDGYAALWDVPSQTLSAEEDSRNGSYGMSFVEVIRKGAFSRAIAQSQDVRCLWNHEDEDVLGRTASGTLTLREDDIGLRFECLLPDTSLGRDVAELVRRGDVNQCSFAFSVVTDRWSGGGASGYVRELLDVDLYDVGPVTYPAYLQTSVQVRSGVRLPSPPAERPSVSSLTRARARARVAML